MHFPNSSPIIRKDRKGVFSEDTRIQRCSIHVITRDEVSRATDGITNATMASKVIVAKMRSTVTDEM
jgi:hypothetical protein